MRQTVHENMCVCVLPMQLDHPHSYLNTYAHIHTLIASMEKRRERRICVGESRDENGQPKGYER